MSSKKENELDDGWVNWTDKPNESKAETHPVEVLSPGQRWEERMQQEIEGEKLMAK